MDSNQKREIQKLEKLTCSFHKQHPVITFEGINPVFKTCCGTFEEKLIEKWQDILLKKIIDQDAD